MNAQTLLANVAELVKTKLKPLVDDIDRKGYYPEAFMRELGAIGAVGIEAEGGNGLGLATRIAVLREIGKECGATSFSAWCQAACAWYLHQTPNQAVKDKYLADILQGKVLAGTGMSNTVKHLAGIEKHNLQAECVDGGYKVNGALPWVSNIGEDHIWANTAQIGGGYVMFITGGQREGVSLQNCPEFCALEGTRTFSLNFKDVFIPDEDIIAAPEQFAGYIQSIKAGFILLQIGIGAGVIDGSSASSASPTSSMQKSTAISTTATTASKQGWTARGQKPNGSPDWRGTTRPTTSPPSSCAKPPPYWPLPLRNPPPCIPARKAT